MRKKAMCVVIVAATLGTVAVLYRTSQPNAYRVEDILAVYQQLTDYGGITIWCPPAGKLFSPEAGCPLKRQKTVSRRLCSIARLLCRLSRRTNICQASGGVLGLSPRRSRRPL